MRFDHVRGGIWTGPTFHCHAIGAAFTLAVGCKWQVVAMYLDFQWRNTVHEIDWLTAWQRFISAPAEGSGYADGVQWHKLVKHLCGVKI